MSRRAIRESCVYIVIGDNGVCKVGVAIDPCVRAYSLQKEFPGAGKLTVHYATPRRADAYKVEARTHDLLSEHLVFGREWFSVTPRVACKALAHALGLRGVRSLPVYSGMLTPRSALMVSLPPHLVPLVGDLQMAYARKEKDILSCSDVVRKAVVDAHARLKRSSPSKD